MSTVSRQTYRLIHSPRAGRVWLAVMLVVLVAFGAVATWSMAEHVLSGCTAHHALYHGGMALQLLAGLAVSLVIGAAVTRVVIWYGPESQAASHDTSRADGIANATTRRPLTRRVVWRLRRGVSSDDDPLPASPFVAPRILTALTPRLRFFARCGGSSLASSSRRSASGRLPMLPPARAPVALPT